MVLITQVLWPLLSSACITSRLFLSLCSQRVGWVQARHWEGTQPARLTAGGQRDDLHHMAPCSATKTEIEGQTLFQGGYRLETGWASVCLWEVMSVMSDYLCITWHHTFFLHLLNCFYLDPQVFSLSFFLFSLPSHWGEGRVKRAAVWVLGCW